MDLRNVMPLFATSAKGWRRVRRPRPLPPSTNGDEIELLNTRDLPSPPSFSAALAVVVVRQPENVLLDARGSVKLTGFALAGLFDPSLGDNNVENLLHATCGTPDYTAPEVLTRSLTADFGKFQDALKRCQNPIFWWGAYRLLVQ